MTLKYNLQEAIEKRKIIPFSDGPKIIKKELEAARDDLKDAKDVFSLKKYKNGNGLFILCYFSYIKSVALFKGL